MELAEFDDWEPSPEQVDYLLTVEDADADRADPKSPWVPVAHGLPRTSRGTAVDRQVQRRKKRYRKRSAFSRAIQRRIDHYRSIIAIIGYFFR